MSETTKKQFAVPYPEMHVFRKGVDTATSSLLKAAPQPVYMIEKIDYPEEGGIFVYHQDLLFPSKGFPFPEACEANNILKKYFIGQIRLLAKNPLYALSLLRKKNLVHWLREFSWMCQATMDRFFLADIRYSKPCREIRKFIEIFLTELGYEQDVTGVALGIITMLEYDNAYLLRLQDLANETSAELLLKSPIRESKRLINILKERDSEEQRATLRAKFEAAFFLASIILLIPKVRRAMKKAMDGIDFTKIQMDEADRYYVLRWNGYNFFGESDEVRIEKFKKMHNYIPPRQYIIKLVGE